MSRRWVFFTNDRSFIALEFSNTYLLINSKLAAKPRSVLQHGILRNRPVHLKVFISLRPLVKNTQRRLMLLATVFQWKEGHLYEQKLISSYHPSGVLTAQANKLLLATVEARYVKQCLIT